MTARPASYERARRGTEGGRVPQPQLGPGRAPTQRAAHPRAWCRQQGARLYAPCPDPTGPCGGKGALEHGAAGGKDDGDIEPQHRLNETPTDSGAGYEPGLRSTARRESMSRGAGCGNSARPELSGAGVGKLPRPTRLRHLASYESSDTFGGANSLRISAMTRLLLLGVDA
jgi:hypothetical protein